MPIIIGLFALITPRLVIVLLAVFSDYLGRAYDTMLVPILGFLLLPMTTLAYAWSVNTYGSVEGLGLVAVIVSVVLDLGLHGRVVQRRRVRLAHAG